MNAGDTGNSGHRARLRKRLLDGGETALLDHELIEYLLALAIPRRDTKPLARQLLAEYGGIGGLLSIDSETLIAGGLSEAATAAIKIAQAAALRLLRARVQCAPMLTSWQTLLDYLHADLAYLTIERVRLLHLNTRNMLIRDEVVANGSVDEVAVHVREVIRRAIELRTTSMIIVHNHPSGNPTPSPADIELTRRIAAAASPLGIRLHDHLIIGAQDHYSLREMGYLP